MLKIIRTVKEMFTKDFWIQDFPEYYPPECFDCNNGSCEGCLIIAESTEERLINQQRCDAGMFLC